MRADEMEITGNELSIGRVLQISAYVVIVAWGIREASHLLSVILISLLWAYAVLPFPRWLMRRFRRGKNLATALTALFLIAVHVVVYAGLFGAAFRLRLKLPMYEAHFSAMYASIAAFLSSHGLQLGTISLHNFYRSERSMQIAENLIVAVSGYLSDRLLVALLSVIFLVEMAEAESAGVLARNLAHYGQDIQQYISITAQTGAIGAVANLVVLLALRVDFPFLWCFLFFLLHFIPNIGFILSMIPPAFVALLEFGWQRALLVMAGFIVTQILCDYVVQPLLMKRGLHISFLQITLSLIIWGFLLGPVGAILAIPLTMASKRFIDNLSGRRNPALASG